MTRTIKTNYTAPTFAWKNVKNWWTTTHVNPDSTTTAWTARMKPLWFTELGFPSVDGCSNQPNVFYDPHAFDSFFPRGSFGQVDFSAQRNALNASLDFLAAQNTVEPNLVPVCIIWTWDARPFPFWPDLQTVWADYADWKTGHWIEGKVGLSNLGQVVAALCAKTGLDSTLIDVTRLTDTIDGYAVTSRQTVVTAHALDLLRPDEIALGLARHVRGDWGDLCPEDMLANENALTQGGRLFSAYGQGATRFWIITEWDRSVTTVLMPQDY